MGNREQGARDSDAEKQSYLPFLLCRSRAMNHSNRLSAARKFVFLKRSIATLRSTRPRAAASSKTPRVPVVRMLRRHAPADPSLRPSAGCIRDSPPLRLGDECPVLFLAALAGGTTSLPLGIAVCRCLPPLSVAYTQSEESFKLASRRPRLRVCGLSSEKKVVSDSRLRVGRQPHSVHRQATAPPLLFRRDA